MSLQHRFVKVFLMLYIFSSIWTHANTDFNFKISDDLKKLGREWDILPQIPIEKWYFSEI